MSLEIKFRAEERNLKDENHIYSARISPSSRKGFHGLYIFPLICKSLQLFQRSGFYTFSFSIVSSLSSFCLCQYNEGYYTMIIPFLILFLSFLRRISLCQRESNCRNLVKTVQVNALSEIERWGLLGNEQSEQCVLR